MFKGLVAGFVLAVLAIGGGVWFYFASGRAPVAVTDPDMPFEKTLAHAALNARIDRQAPQASLVPADEANLLAGAEVYRQNCAVCHGLPGQAPTNIAASMYPKPPQLFHGVGVTDDPAFESYWKAANGIRLSGMPGFRGKLTETQLWQVGQLVANADKIPDSVKNALAPDAPLARPEPSAK
ncbi:MAG: cytochrome c [Candidatus Acidiferrales bacterium]